MKERRLIWTEAEILCFFRAKGPLATDDPMHFVPCRISAVETILGVTYAAMVNMNFPNKSTPVPRVVDWVFPLVVLSIIPRKKVLVPDFNFSPIANEINSELGLVEMPLDP